MRPCMRKVVLTSNEDLKKPFSGEDLEHWRKGLHWTQRQAAEWLGVSVRSIENWERGWRSPRHPVAMKRLMAGARTRYRKRLGKL